MSEETKVSNNNMKIFLRYVLHMLLTLVFAAGVAWFSNEIVLEHAWNNNYYIFSGAILGVIVLCSLLERKKIYVSVRTVGILIACFLVSALLLLLSDFYVNLPIWLIGGIAAAALANRNIGMLYLYYFVFHAIYLQGNWMNGLVFHFVVATLIAYFIPKMKTFFSMFYMMAFAACLIVTGSILHNQMYIDGGMMLDTFYILCTYLACIFVTMLLVKWNGGQVRAVEQEENQVSNNYAYLDLMAQDAAEKDAAAEAARASEEKVLAECKEEQLLQELPATEVTDTELIKMEVNKVEKTESEKTETEITVSETCDEVIEESEEKVTEEIIEEVTEEIAEETTEEATEEITEETTEEATEEITEEITEEATEEATEDIAEEVLEETTEEIAEEVLEETTEEITEKVAEMETKEEDKAISEISETEVLAEEQIIPQEEVVEEIMEEPVIEIDYSPYCDEKAPLLQELRVKDKSAHARAILVGKLAAETAECIGLNVQLTKAAGLYKIIGKIRENCNEYTSTEVAKEHNFPEPLIYLLDQLNHNIIEQKEAAVILMTDGVISYYSIVRAAKKLDIPVEKIVDTIVSKKIFQGEFNESGLNMQECFVLREKLIALLKVQDKKHSAKAEERKQA